DRRQKDPDRLLFVEHRHDQRQQRVDGPPGALRRKLALERGRWLGRGRRLGCDGQGRIGHERQFTLFGQATLSTAPLRSMMPSSTLRSGWRFMTSARNWRSASWWVLVSNALSVLMRWP